jgi:hypothetical protein
MVLEPGVVLGAVPPWGTGVVVDVFGAPDVVPPIPDWVPPSVPGTAPVGLSTPGAGVDCVGGGEPGDADGSNVPPVGGGVDGVSPPPGVLVPGTPVP